MPTFEQGPDLSGQEVPSELRSVQDFLSQVAGHAEAVDTTRVADLVSDVVVSLRENQFVGRLIEKWGALSYEEQREAVQADQGVLSRLFSVSNVVPFAPGKIQEIKSSFLKSMLYYGVIEFKDQGDAASHEALIESLHLNDQAYANWVKLLLKGVGVFAPEARPLVVLLDQLEALLEKHGEVSAEIRVAVREKIVHVLDQREVDAA